MQSEELRTRVNYLAIYMCATKQIYEDRGKENRARFNENQRIIYNLLVYGSIIVFEYRCNVTTQIVRVQLNVLTAKRTPRERIIATCLQDTKRKRGILFGKMTFLSLGASFREVRSRRLEWAS